MYNQDYLKLLSKQYPNVDAVTTEIINLSAILKLPKGTEHFLTDIHGEYEAFTHVLRNASGVVKRKIQETFGNTLSEEEQELLATVIYYPHRKIRFLKKNNQLTKEWMHQTIYNMVLVLRTASFKYSRSKVRKAFPSGFSYIIEELVWEKETSDAKLEYYSGIIETIITTGSGEKFIIDLARVIRKLVVDRLHIIGDIYDRGPGAHLILDDLMNHHSVDIQWGNHDILWMGAAAGSKACMSNLLRIALRYGSLETLQIAYGINLVPLARLALSIYGDDQADLFMPKLTDKKLLSKSDQYLIAKMQKAITIIQLKLEAQIINRRPEFAMDDRLLFHGLSDDFKTIEVNGVIYEMKDSNFPTIDPVDPYALSAEEEEVVDKLHNAFIQSEKLQTHVKFLYQKGSMYLKYNGNLLYHGCVPMTKDGSFKSFKRLNAEYKGKNLFDFFEMQIRNGYFSKHDDIRTVGQDYIWYTWCGECSPLFGKKKMATFERAFIDEKVTHKEEKDYYYTLREDEAVIDKILLDFDLKGKECKVINGHVPVKAIKGEHPVKSNGKLISIDGGFSKAYQDETGIAGYTLIYNSRGIILVAHDPFDSIEKAITKNKDSIPHAIYIKEEEKRVLVENTDIGKNLQSSIYILEDLLMAYRKGDLIPTKK